MPAYGGALAVERAATVTDSPESTARTPSAVDFHKLFYQPISCGRSSCSATAPSTNTSTRNASYLNPEADEKGRAESRRQVHADDPPLRRAQTVPHVPSRSGGAASAALIDGTIELADDVAALLSEDDSFELVAEPTLNAVVFRYRPHDDLSDDLLGWINEAIRESLLREGEAVLARTEADGVSALKFTLLNPRTTLSDVAAVLDTLERRGDSLCAVSPEVSR